MTINKINPLWQSENFGVDTANNKTQNDGIPVFSDILNTAISNVKQTEAERVEADYLLATGQLDNPAILSMANSKAEIAVQLMVQMRNKALESYNTITSMSM
ncbi:MAG TPA: flagellar hook-basal body complex protein FliE [Candidatus Butyricicoccus avistercoris]|uniref:Flagellar hook-basal body complex protein FliE n=1 Tax=Candidatus Butyricicoccus avistercoris TaxID=2838518 RepID=A0A9D1PGP7_9FIRM|nr:flagellar hook-basal body complex protein FliE [Candidatus Butyricicoccus avistercoris]